MATHGTHPATLHRTISRQYSATKHFFLPEYLNALEGLTGNQTNNAVCVGILTSGGDAPGMNPALRTIVRGLINSHARVFGIRDGYEGLVRGSDEDIREMFWNDVGGILHIGGTFLGTARCDEFRTEAGRKKVVRNLLRHGINRLIIIGGDGSLTGAKILADNWPGFVREILDEYNAATDKSSYLWYDLYWKSRLSDIMEFHVVGLVGSIDNDMGNTSMTIGCDSALHRICVAIDTLSSTAASHRRDFIVEVMGRQCGWLGLKAAVACACDFVFIPEDPAPENWAEKLLVSVSRGRQVKRNSIIILAEGACDVNLRKISAADVKAVLDAAGSECRITTLGHVQRGGAPSFYDRAHTMLLGHEAVRVVLSGQAKDEPQIICVNGLFDPAIRPLSTCLTTCKAITQSIADKNFGEAMKLRGPEFVRAYNALNTIFRSNVRENVHGTHNICVCHIGACAPGMNTVVRAIVRMAIAKNYCCFAALDGVDGLQTGNLREMGWMDVNGWSPLGGAKLGTSRFVPAEMDLRNIARNIKRHGINTLVMMGGWDGYICMLHLREQADKYPIFGKINIMLIPCTISNNLPITQFTIGTDTALNCIVDAVDKIKQSAIAHKRIFVIEVMGAHCGFLATFGAFATGAEKIYISEVPTTLDLIQADMNEIRDSFNNKKSLALVFTTESSSKTFDTKLITKLYREISPDNDVRMSILGHLQQGGAPTPMDRFLAVEMAYDAINRIETWVSGNLSGQFESVCLVDGQVTFATPEQFVPLMDMKYRRPKTQWWFPKIFDVNRQYAGWTKYVTQQRFNV